MDEIIGIAILTRTQPQRLLIACRKANGNTFYDSIPAYGVADGKPCEQAWQHQIVGDTLHVHPSVHFRYQLPPDPTWRTRFHNGYQWAVKFQWANEVDDAAVFEQFKAANADIKFSHGL